MKLTFLRVHESDKIKTVSQGETTTVATRATASYVPFALALEHDFSSLRKRDMKRSGPVLWGVLGAASPPAFVLSLAADETDSARRL